MTGTPKASANGWLIAALFALPAISVAIKLTGTPLSEWWMHNASMTSLPRGIAREMDDIMFVPLGALVVVFVRLTLGLRLMGPFRSILLAIAFRITGVVTGIAFLFVAVLTIAAIRPAARAAGLGYYARITVMLSSVAVLMIGVVLLSNPIGIRQLQDVAHFPIVVLCLVADAYSRTREKEGTSSAVWRVAITALVAIPLALLSAESAFRGFMSLFPELVVAQIGAILFIARFMDWKSLEFLNPVNEGDVTPPAKMERSPKGEPTTGPNVDEQFQIQGSNNDLIGID